MAKRQAPLHPAIAAIRGAHSEMRAFMAGKGVGACFDSDLRHDEVAIKKAPDQPFVWMVSPHATYMAGLGTPADCLAATCGTFASTGAASLIKSLCTGCYEPSAIPDGWLRLYLWNTSLVRYPTADALCEATARLIRGIAAQHLAGSRRQLSELLAAHRADGSTFAADARARDIRALDEQIAQIEGWGP